MLNDVPHAMCHFIRGCATRRPREADQRRNMAALVCERILLESARIRTNRRPSTFPGGGATFAVSCKSCRTADVGSIMSDCVDETGYRPKAISESNPNFIATPLRNLGQLCRLPLLSTIRSHPPRLAPCTSPRTGNTDGRLHTRRNMLALRDSVFAATTQLLTIDAFETSTRTA